MQNGKHKTTQLSFSKIILLSAIIGLSVGLILWFWQNSANSNKSSQVVSDNVQPRVVVEGTKPVILENNLPAADPQLELLGDKLAEVSFHLREQQTEVARQVLAEASDLALKTDDNPKLQENLVNGIKQVQNNLENGKTKEAEQEINTLLNQLDMPEN